jgi:OMF family outer membrane factor
LRGVQPITLQQAIELAIRNNRTLQISQQQLQRSRAAVQEAQAELFPTLSVQGNVARSQSPGGELQRRTQEEAQAQLPDFLQQEITSDQLSRGFNAAATLNYNVFTSGGRPARIRAAREQLRSDELQVEITREQLLLDVSNDYYDLQEADENVRIRLASVRNAQASLRDTQALERAGLGTRFDVLRAEVQLANEVQALTNGRALQFQRRRQLVQRLSMPAWVDLAAADPVQEAGTWSLPLDATIILALKNRAELVQQLAQRELSEQQRRSALSGLGPTLNVSAQYQLADNFKDTLGPGDGYTIAAGIQWNLFDGGQSIARARQAEANKDIAETRFADANNQIRQQVETAYSNLRSNFENITTTRRAVEQAREALRLARLRFQAGVGTQTDVINAENDLTRAEGNAVTAIIGYNRALAALRRAVSNLSIGAAPAATGTP